MALQHLRSNTASKRPTAGAMSDGQIAVNTNATSPGLFFKDAGGAIIKVGPVHVGTTAPNSSPAAGGSTGNGVGEQWLDTSGGGYVLKIWDGSAWRSEVGEFVDAAGDTMTGALILPSGTAVAPALGVGSTDNGIYSPGTDQVAISTNGSEAVRIDNSGRLLVGTIAPGGMNGGTIVAGDETGTGGSVALAIKYTNTDVINTFGSAYSTGNTIVGHAVRSSTSAINTFLSTTAFGFKRGALQVGGELIYSNAAQQTTAVGSEVTMTERFRVTNAGNVGIGTGSPAELLHVEGASSPTIRIRNSTFGSNASPESAFLSFTGHNQEGRVRFESQDRRASVGGGFLNIATANTSNVLTNALHIDNQQRVGIGSTTPQGDLSFGASVSTINLDTSDGSDNKRLALNGGGGGINSGRGGYIALSGNEATNPGSVQISMGNTSGTSIVFNKGDGSEVGRWDSSGRLGIGNSSPGSYNSAANDLVIGSHSGSNGMTICSQNNASGYIMFADGTTGPELYSGQITYDHVNNRMTFGTTDGTTALTIDSSQRVGIGTTDPSGAGASAYRDLVIAGTGNRGITIQCGSGNVAGTVFNTSNGGNAGGYIYDSANAQMLVSAGGGTGNIAFNTNNAERARIDSSGRLLVGTTSPGALSGGSIIAGNTTATTGSVALGVRYLSTDTLNIFGSMYSSANTLIGYGVRSSSAAANTFLSTADNGNFKRGALEVGGELVYSNGAAQTTAVGSAATMTERFRIHNAGYITIGNPDTRLVTNDFQGGGAGIAQLLVETNGLSAGTFANYRNDRYGPAVSFVKSRGTTPGSNDLVANDDRLGGISFAGGDGTNAINGASITAFVDGTPGTNDMPGRLVFSTTADGASSPTERMRIDSDGTMLLGVSTKIISQTTNPYLFFQAQSAVSTTGLSIESYGNNIATRYHFAFTNPNGVVGTISTNGTATAYNTSSDYRLKENVTPVTDGITRLQQLKPSRFNFIADPAKTVDGFLAHEVQTTVPEAITGEKDAVDDDGNPVYQGIDQSKLVPLLTAALQEAIGEIESLKARLTAAGL